MSDTDTDTDAEAAEEADTGTDNEAEPEAEGAKADPDPVEGNAEAEPEAADTGIFVATKNAQVLHGGRRVHLRRGETTARAGHPILEGRSHMFRPLTVDFDRVEQATSRPGEKSNAVRGEKAELLAEAERLGLKVKPRTKVADLRRLIDDARQGSGE